MPAKPNPNGKTNQIILKAKIEWEREIKAFKEICARNEIEMSTELYERGIKSFLKEHNWPPGNSQTQIKSFVEGDLREKCYTCEGHFPILHKVKFVSGLVASVCAGCLEEHKNRGVVKKIL